MLRPNTFALTATLALMTALGPLSMDMYLASLPDIERLMSATTADVQLTISIYLIGFAIAQILYGPFSDRYGRRPVLLFALAVFTAASLACAAARSIDVLIAARFVQSLGGAGAAVIARAIVRDLYAGPRAGRELSLMGAVMALAPIIAPVLGGGLHIAFGWQSNFLLVVAAGFVIAAIVWKLLPETLPQRVTEPISIASIIGGFGVFLADRRYLAYLGIIAFSYAGLFAWISGATFVLQRLYGLDPFEFGVAFGVSCAGYLVGTLIAAKLVMRSGIGLTIGVGVVAQALGGLSMVLAVALASTSPIWILTAIALYLAGLGFTGPQAMAGALTPFPERAGAASSLFGFVQQSWSAIVGAAVGHLLGNSAWPMAAAIAVMGVMALVIWAMTRHIRRRADRGVAR
ncbi:MAG: Bcr/CflA family efflux MFS transporter [Rhizobiales bacterium]|nr:Bcr/CflA family efflux MFS transporter [Hyphomicrobiales bacterium]